jgi:glutamate N-acetyltransferase/amino-acid N-acetyltransferase
MKDKRVASFGVALNNVLQNLAKQIVCDGEGAKKLITINVEGAKTEKAARKIGMSVANSALVKTAVAGEDANWGRVVMAIGKAGISIFPSLLSISIGNIVVSELGSISRKHSESKLSKYMKNQEIKININLAQGDCSAKVWTCDLTHDYIRINADYRS